MWLMWRINCRSHKEFGCGATDSVDNVHGGGSLAVSMLNIGDGIMDDILQEYIESSAGLFLDQSTNNSPPGLERRRMAGFLLYPCCPSWTLPYPILSFPHTLTSFVLDLDSKEVWWWYFHRADHLYASDHRPGKVSETLDGRHGDAHVVPEIIPSLLFDLNLYGSWLKLSKEDEKE